MNQLTDEEKRSYLQTIIYIVAADGNVSQEEDNALKAIASNMGFTRNDVDHLTEQVKSGKQLTDILLGIKTRSTKLLLIYELITMCYADGQYVDAEKESVAKIAKLVKIEQKKVTEIENLIAEYIEFQKRVNKVLEVAQ